MESLTEILFTLSTALLAPVIVLLLAATAWTLLELGGILFEGRERRVAGVTGLVAAYKQRTRRGDLDALQCERIATDLELAASARVARMYLGVRLGPMLGLMGTLIPLGPALMGLVDMNIEAISRNLFVGFATTVLGLLVGGLCYVMAAVRRQWYARDLADVEFLAAQAAQHDRVSHAIVDNSPSEMPRRPSPSLSGR
jgi:hypothetical protein